MNVHEEKLRIEAMLNESEGLITPEIEQVMRQFDTDFKSKIKFFLDKYLMTKALGEELKNRKELLEKRISGNTGTLEFYKGYIDSLLKLEGYKKLDIDIYSLSYLPSKKVVVYDQDEIPDKYFKIKQERILDKLKLKEVLSGSNVTISGVALEEFQNLQIK